MSDREPSYAEVVRKLMELSGWSREEVIAQPRDAAWVAYSRVSQWRSIIEAGGDP